MKMNNCLNIRIHSTLNTQHSTLNTQHSTLNTQHSTLNTQHSTTKNLSFIFQYFSFGIAQNYFYQCILLIVNNFLLNYFIYQYFSNSKLL